MLTTLRNLFVVAGLLMISSSAFSQETLTESGSTVVDSVTAVEQELAKQYERFKLAIDTVTGLVTYIEIVEQPETGPDSFYIRARKWSRRKYNLEVNKHLVMLDKPNEKMMWKGHFDAYTSTGQYNKVYNGTITFIITLIFKDDKFKYIIDNIYWEPSPPATKEEEKLHANDSYSDLHVPIEYYLTAKTRVMVNDNKLQCADIEFQALIKDLKKSLKNPIQFDQDDF